MGRRPSDRGPSTSARAGAAVAVAMTVFAVASPAAAHPGHGGHGETGFAAGLLHPLTGVDHLLAILAVGVVAVLLAARRAAWAVPFGFVGGMAAGGLLGLVGGARHLLEIGVGTSVVALGLMILALARRGTRAVFPWVIGAVAVFGAAHGHAHGAALPAGVGALDYGVGVLITTVALLVAGTLLGVGLRRSPAMGLAAGGVVSMAGVVLLAGA